MGDRPNITVRDLQALVTGSLFRHNDEQVQAWLDREDFDSNALVAFAEFAVATWRISGARVEALALMSFQLGWDAHRDLRGESTHNRKGKAH